MNTHKQESRQKLINDFLSLSRWRYLEKFSKEEERIIIAKVLRYARWWIRQGHTLPEPGQQEDRVAAGLLQLSEVSHDDIKFILEYIASRLNELANSNREYEFETELSADQFFFIYAMGAVLLSNGPHDFVLYISSRLRLGIIEVAVKAFEGCMSRRYPKLLAAVTPELADYLSPAELTPQSRAFLQEWLTEIDLTTIGRQAVGKIIFLILDHDFARHLLQSRDANFLLGLHRYDKQLMERLVMLMPDVVANILSQLWDNVKDWESMPHMAKPLLSTGGEYLLRYLPLELGYEIGLYAQDTQGDPKDASLAQHFIEENEISIAGELPIELIRQGTLWATMRRLAAYESEAWKHSTELIGLRVLVREFAEKHPEEWARALPWLLARSHLLGGIVEVICISLSKESEVVYNAIKRCAEQSSSMEVRDRARGVVALCHGFISPQEQLSHDILSFAARQIDGQLAFPHPLEPMSGTWLGSLDVEHVLRKNIQAAERQFSSYFTQQGMIEEEAGTSRLLTDLEYAFQHARLGVSALGKPKDTTPTSIKFSQKQVPKKEETIYGCDLALIVTGIVPDALKLESAEIVQVKKPQTVTRRGLLGPEFNDSWRINVEQLRDIIRFSQTSAYWLIEPNGEVLVIPARLLYAILEGKDQLEQGSATVHYYQIRSMCIPLWQFLVNLFLGIWLGTADEQVLRFARGEDARTQPRHIVEIEVRFRSD